MPEFDWSGRARVPKLPGCTCHYQKRANAAAQLQVDAVIVID